MKIETYKVENHYDLSSRDLLNYLSQVILSKTDEKIEIEQTLIKENKEQVQSLRVNLKSKKEMLKKILEEKKRVETTSKVIKIIHTLSQEGGLIGNSRSKLSRTLFSLNDKSYKQLRSLEEKLSMYLPEHYNRITIS